jgi:predicted RNase H-like HicB family nuclease
MKTKLEDYIKLPYSVRVVPDQSTERLLCYMAYHPDLSGCMSHGDTPEEALANLSEVKKLYIKTLIEKKQDIPLPTSSAKTIWEVADLEEVKTPLENLYSIPTKVSPLIETLRVNEEEVAIS